MSESAGTTKPAVKTTTVGLLGCTGKAGGWVLEEGLKRGYNIRALVRKPEKIESYTTSHPSQLTVVVGSSTDEKAVAELLVGTDVVIGTLGSPNNNTLVMTPSAETLVAALKKMEDPLPRIIWMTTIGVNDAIPQGHKYGCTSSFFPSCTCCCGYGVFGCLAFNCLIPCIIGRNLWDDMGTSEDVFTEEGGKIMEKTVIVRPTNMTPPSEHAAFTEEWRKEGGENTAYLTRRAEEAPPNMWITRRAISAFLLDCVEDTKFDGQAVSLFQG